MKVVLIGALLALIGRSTLAGEMYRWVDEKGVVHFTDNLHNIPEPYRSNTGRIKTPMAREPQNTPADRVSVPFHKKGEVVIVEALINEKATGSFIVDTGASYTIISQATARELEIDLGQDLPTIPFQTANGIIRAPLVTLAALDVGGMRLRDLTAAVYDVFPDSRVSGLLGLNFLSHFRIDIDTRNQLLHLERK